MVVRHRDQPGVLAHVFDILRDSHVNVQETENIIFTGAQAAVARINLDGEPTDEQLRRIRIGNPDIFDVQVVPLGAPAASYQLAKSLSTW
jgi:D-3-phosphoglycerate dehydrogenase